ncbi:PefC/AfrB family outer membrane usher protein [Escherichia coli]|uniref:PefC/AfrB family outer membrane usher protein n=1 Tax=Escherichia coli TaxID=562 RepID=UPI0013D36DC7|nr:PefC/AfrB family outer membrane usher protein [Escherichia coli]EJN3598248.1 PefC/AfrB family outer membrane usher protein [Escherichia coli]EJN3608133.1 PefC/AfrB family outer membrane usher protein [Escherichia coli]EJN3740631.1 PefC/AfrB family outer membrane usher protein [Escherichia coli]EJN3881319.1 PefC/AfrB family outer membrane usher protein [Escherichia coli]EJN4312641.1 PefC/AfrB family outer membrane usher protein [Escherichia coli]
MSSQQIFKLSALSLFMFSVLSYASSDVVGSGDADLNMDFLQGTRVVPSVLKKGVTLPSGQYEVDVVVNNDNLGKSQLIISPEEEKSGVLCLSPAWLKSAGVPLRLDGYAAEFDERQGCYALGKNPYTRVDFNYGSQGLVFSIPQSYLLSKTDPSQWDYGVNALRLNYSANAARNSGQETTAYGSVSALVNIGRWVLSSNMNASRLSDGKNEFAVRDATLSTALGGLKSDLIVGKSTTRSDLFQDFGFYGVALRSNSNMSAWDFRGYAPVISGVATSSSRITITQNGYTVYSRVVPPGPYALDDIHPVGNGDLEVTVEDASGRKTVTRYPVTTLPTLLRPGELQYDMVAGRRSSGGDMKKPFSDSDKGMFWSGSLAYGLGSTTLGGAAILHDRYKAGGLSLTQMMGELGAFSLAGTVSDAEYDNNVKKHGYSVSAKYAKSFASDTDLQLTTYRYQSKGYVEFSGFDPADRYARYNQKSRYEATLSQRLTDNVSLSLFGWWENYWNTTGYATGGTLSTGFSLFDSVSMSVSGNYSRYPYMDKPDYSIALITSIPFSIGDKRQYVNSSAAYSSVSGTSFRASTSGSPTERLSYNVSAGLSSRGSDDVGAGVSYAFDATNTSLNVSQSRHNTSVSGSISGSVVVTAESGLFFTRDQSNTMAVVRIPDVEGVRINGSAPTNSRGYTSVGLSEYSQNHIDVNMENVPDDLDLMVTSQLVVPTGNAVVYRQFGANYVKRYVLQIKDSNGQLLTGGNARTGEGLNAGIISRNGVLSMGMLAEPKEVRVDLGDGGTCRFSMTGIKPEATRVQEVRCE